MNTSDQLLDTLYSELTALKRVMMSSRSHVLGELALTRTQVEVLTALGEKDDRTVSEIADHLMVSHSAATQTIETMVKRGLVGRSADMVDRRIVRAILTSDGRQLADTLCAGRKNWFYESMEGLTEAELELMITAFRTMSKQFSNPNVSVKEKTSAQ